MTNIHFSFNATEKLQIACLITAKHYAAGDALAVYCRDKARLAAFDRLLWDYQRSAFVPHVGADDLLAGSTPVVLYARPPAAGHAWVLNLDNECVPQADTFANIIEVVGIQRDERARGRERWRHYQAAGHAIVQYDLAHQELP